MKVGCTATHKGLRPLQKDGIRKVLQDFYDKGARELHHGDCIGGDDQIATIAQQIGYRLVAHPGFNPKKVADTSFRAFHPSHVLLPVKPFLMRDRDIVDAVDVMVAGPLNPYEVRRSGTWTTVRYCRDKVKKPLYIVCPNGEVEQYNV